MDKLLEQSLGVLAAEGDGDEAFDILQKGLARLNTVIKDAAPDTQAQFFQRRARVCYRLAERLAPAKKKRAGWEEVSRQMTEGLADFERVDNAIYLLRINQVEELLTSAHADLRRARGLAPKEPSLMADLKAIRALAGRFDLALGSG